MTSPVVRADSKFYGTPPFLCVDVRFNTVQELDDLIRALEALRNQNSESPDHVHLQDYHTKFAAVQSTSAEVTFWGVGMSREHDSLVETERFFKALNAEETK